MEPNAELVLLAEWRQLASEMADLEEKRGQLVGMLVEKDDLALAYQQKSARIWHIKVRLFGTHWIYA